MKVYTERFKNTKGEVMTVSIKQTKKGITILEPDHPLNKTEAKALVKLLTEALQNEPTGPFLTPFPRYPKGHSIVN